MNKSAYIPFICGSCDLHFAILKKDYNKKDCYTCPICMLKSIVTPEDLKPVKPFRPTPPTVVGREL